uniref:Pectinesterase n=1 Tax=Kalanchoe fedtschenkoi TaxID=63787 RepID=A0A7N0SZF2_KALFE
MLIFFILAFCTSMVSSAATASSAAAICKSTPDPAYCKTLLPRTSNSSANIYDYGRFSVRKSISQARKFSSIINKYLARKSQLSTPAVRALEDCKYLADLNLDFLTSTFSTVSSTSRTLPSLKAEDVQTLLSAILTNQQTCFDGISSTTSAWRVRNGITQPISNDTKLYSVSLALFTRGWVPERKNKKHSTTRNVRQGAKMYETLTKRNLLQATGDDSDDGGEVLVREMVTVSQDGTGNFTTITDAVNAAPNNTQAGNGYFLIYVTAGVYEEYVVIAKNKRYLMMIGDGINQTVVTGNRSVVDGWTTFNSATFVVTAPGFVMVNMTIRNTAGAVKHQAVALRSGADLSAFYSCSFEAYQDTLYTHSLRQFYRDCDIYGTVDFIFGNAAVVLQNCNLYPRLPMSGQFNAITAQGRTDPNQNTGTSIQSCNIMAAPDLAASDGTTRTYLGRPWKEYSRTVYMQSYMDGSVDPTGWNKWNGDFALDTLCYAEFDNTGPGSDTAGRVAWPGYQVINATVAMNFTVSNFLLGDEWLPQTGVTYTTGLV